VAALARLTRALAPATSKGSVTFLSLVSIASEADPGVTGQLADTPTRGLVNWRTTLLTEDDTTFY